MENAKASGLESVQAITSELNGAKGSLQNVVYKESSLRSLVESRPRECEERAFGIEGGGSENRVHSWEPACQASEK
ncbi:hypothetical protein V6N13_136831 [Hibiscus sabdariffa]